MKNTKFKICLFLFVVVSSLQNAHAQLFPDETNFKYSFIDKEESVPTLLWGGDSFNTFIQGIEHNGELISLFKNRINIYSPEKKSFTHVFYYINKNRYSKNQILLNENEIILLNSTELLFFDIKTEKRKKIELNKPSNSMAILNDKLLVADDNGGLKRYNLKNLNLENEYSISTNAIKALTVYNQKLFFLETAEGKSWLKAFNPKNNEKEVFLEINNQVFNTKIEFNTEKNKVLFKSILGLNLFDLASRKNVIIPNPWGEYTNYGFLKNEKIFISIENDIAFYDYKGNYFYAPESLMYWKYHLRTCYKLNDGTLRFFDSDNSWIDYNTTEQKAYQSKNNTYQEQIGNFVFSNNNQNIGVETVNHDKQFHLISFNNNKEIISFKDKIDYSSVNYDHVYCNILMLIEEFDNLMPKKYSFIDINKGALIKEIEPTKNHNYKFNFNNSFYKDFSYDERLDVLKSMNDENIVAKFNVSELSISNPADKFCFLENEEYYIIYKFAPLERFEINEKETILNLFSIKNNQIVENWKNTKHIASNNENLYLRTEDTLKIYNFKKHKVTKQIVGYSNKDIRFNKDYTQILTTQFNHSKEEFNVSIYDILNNQLIYNNKIKASQFSKFSISPNNKMLILNTYNELVLYDIKTLELIGKINLLVKNEIASLMYIGKDGKAEGDEDYIKNQIKIINNDGTYAPITNRVIFEKGLIKRLLFE